jgi:large subunit ribosomal protein L13
MESKNIQINAEGEKLGRLATKVATILMGKDKATFRKNAIPTVNVTVSNAKLMSLSQKRLDGIVHSNYSGYPGGLYQRGAEEIIRKKGYGELLRHTVSRMLPKNKLRDIMLRNLTIKD